MCCCTCVIKRSKNTRRSTFFDQVTDNLVIEIRYRRPLDLFPDVFFLFGLESKLNEYLLEFLVDIVYTELLK